ERVRNYLQATAKLQFFETYTNQEIYGGLLAAENALSVMLSGGKVDTAATNEVAANDSNNTVPNAADTGSLASLLNKDQTATTTEGSDSAAQALEEAQLKYPIRSLLYIP